MDIRLKTAQMKFMRRTAGYRSLDRKRNYILELEVDLFEKKLAQYKQLHHFYKMEDKDAQNNSLTIDPSEEDMDDH
jgi:hypothetical protein